MGIKIGIDLGTTFSAVAIMDSVKGQPVILPNSDGERITPSVIQFTRSGEIIVGTEAKEAYEAGESGCTSVFKRSMGSADPYCTFFGKSYTAEDLSAIMLAHLKKEAETVTGQTVDEAVVTVPAYFYHKERQATLNAAAKAGLNVRQIINEPTAAALTYAAGHWRENACILVYDLGGGTFDVTLVKMTSGNSLRSLQTIGDHTLGGKDWDARICALIENKLENEIGYFKSAHPEVHQLAMQSAENVKKQLTAKDTAKIKLSLPGYGWYTVSVTLEEFNKSTVDLIKRTGTLCESLLEGLGLSWRGVTDILLVGGSTRMRQVSEFLKSESGHAPLMHVNPDEAVALGAAIQVYLPLPRYGVISMEQESSESKSAVKPDVPEIVGREHVLNNALSMNQSDVVAHAMGIIAVNAEGTKYINKTIIPANQTIPVKCAEAFHFYTSPSGENEIEIYVLQGTKAPLESEIIGKYVVSGIKHDPKINPITIKIQYSYDVNGMIHVQARREKEDKDLPISQKPVPQDMSKFGKPFEKQQIKKVPDELFVIMAIDVSGSMSGAPMKEAKKAMMHFVDRLSAFKSSVKIGIVVVSDSSLVLLRLTDDMKKCKKAIQSVKESMTGYCNAAHPFKDIQLALGNVQGRRIGIVLADGKWDNQGLAVVEAKKCHEMGIDIVGIGFGSADKKFLEDISSGSIESMFVNQNELIQSFGKIAQEIVKTKESSKKQTSASFSVSTWRAVDE